MSTETVEILAAEPDLARGLSGGAREDAGRSCVARVVRAGVGAWDPRGEGPDPGGFGMLVISGFVVRRVGQSGRIGAELLGPGDLLRPWQTVGAGASLPFEPVWKTISPVAIALLERDFARRAAPYPSVAAGLVDRAMLRSRHLAISMAIVHQPRTERRLHMLFWHLADRWGRAVPEGALVDVPLTHSLLGELVAARRPTVSTALGRLAAAGSVERTAEGWLLRGGPPAELDRDRDPGRAQIDGLC
jgi:CRP/FNR family transcriptional regulator, cyclic AMP receptor protein